MSREEQRDATRRALVASASRRFATAGYAATSLPEIVSDAEVTKGALYHHFGSKAELFEAVLSEVQEGVAAQVVRAAESAGSDAWDQMLAGCRAFLEASTDTSVSRIMLIDGPAVLGWSRWRRYDDANSAQHLGEAIAELAAQGVLTGDVDATTRLLSGAMNEAAIWSAEAPAQDRARNLDAAVATLTAMLEGLRTR
ncbi:TetR/AcrR family transcriptional regulator [Microbacterium sp. Mu-80]|uniref:TetR/AcrR family transcriptional regulator n=1 Tax=Microbacterium bandirmense TaxID=3122050 RepID=A0ABU8LD32_9MICO